MNVFIVAVCMNLIILVNAANDINFDTILKILKHKPRKSGYSNIDETNESIEAIPIIPGFYLQKPKELPKSLFENPKDGPDDLISILSNKDTKTRHNNTRISAKAVNKDPRDDYLEGKILKAIKDLKKYQDIQKYKKDALNKSSAYGAQKVPVQKLLGRGFQGIKGGINYRGKSKYKKPRNQNTSSKNEKKIGKILKNILYRSINNKKYRESEKFNYRYDETEENNQNTGDLLGKILDAIQNQDQGQESEIDQRPAVVIISAASVQDDDLELENNAKESIDEDYDGSDSLNLLHTRRNDDSDKRSKSSSNPSDTSDSTGSSEYERNPGNPFTVHKNKYKQNWPYNHYMDGDHMNINPFGPQFGSLGPTGPELFFGRKWWYFNQDDYKPLG